MRRFAVGVVGVCLAALMGAMAWLSLPGPAAGQDSRPLERAIAAAFDAGKLKNLHAVLVIQHGEVLAEAYFPGRDRDWLGPPAMAEHGPEIPHGLWSVTKSVVALLYGIALAEGKVPPPEAAVLPGLPGYADLAGNALRDRITVADLLAMTSGLSWDEAMGWSMANAADSVRFVLGRVSVRPPGEKWHYSSGDTALLGALIETGTGMALDEYARERLFRPLGIGNWVWHHGADGRAAAASGLLMTARDLAKIGQLVLDGGVWDGRRVVPRDWLDALMVPRSELGGVRYGWQWWLADGAAPVGWVSGLAPLPGPGEWPAWVAGLGYGGQRLQVQPDIGLVVVVFSGTYGDPDDWQMPVDLIEGPIADEVRRRAGK